MADDPPKKKFWRKPAESVASDPAYESERRNMGDDGPWPDEEIVEDQRKRDRLHDHKRSPSK